KFRWTAAKLVTPAPQIVAEPMRLPRRCRAMGDSLFKEKKDMMKRAMLATGAALVLAVATFSTAADAQHRGGGGGGGGGGAFHGGGGGGGGGGGAMRGGGGGGGGGGF